MSKVDPRIMRTRKLLMESFIKIAQIKNFKDIIIKDIIEEAQVNRATFYAHFVDKYNLLEAVLSEIFLKNIQDKLSCHDQLSEETVINIFLAVTKFQTDLSSQCKKSYEEFSTTIESKIKKELEAVFYSLLDKQTIQSGDESIKIRAVLLSWSIYGASIDWQNNSSLSAEDYIKLAVHYLIGGMAFPN